MKPGRWSVVGSVVVAIGLLAWSGGVGQQNAAAADGSVKSLTRLANSENEIRSLDAIEKLRRLGTDDAVRALESLSAGTNNRLALRAMSALARSGSPDAEQKMLTVFQDANRADVIRAMALTLWCRGRQSDGAGWEELRGTIEAGAGTDAALLDAAACIQKARFAAKEAK